MGFTARFQIRFDDSKMDIFQILNGLQFNDNRVFNHHIQAMLADSMPVIIYVNENLLIGVQATALMLDQE